MSQIGAGRAKDRGRTRAWDDGNHCRAAHCAAPGVAASIRARQCVSRGLVPWHAEPLFTTPGLVSTHAGGLPVLLTQSGQFLLKELLLIGVALWTLGESLGVSFCHRGFDRSGRACEQ